MESTGFSERADVGYERNQRGLNGLGLGKCQDRVVINQDVDDYRWVIFGQELWWLGITR